MKHSVSSNHVQAPTSKTTKKQTSLCDQSSAANEPNNAEESIADFLIRIDSSIAASKREASKIAKKAQEFGQDEHSSGGFQNMEFSYNAQRNGDDQFLFASSTSGSNFRNQDAKNARTKYRYEKAHDEIFEL